MSRANQLLISFYGDDFTGSTDALEQLSRFGLRAMLFIEPPTRAQLKPFPNLQAVGVAGMTRALVPGKMENELRPALKKLKTLGAAHVHYKVCSTFDSSPKIGSIGRAIDVATEIFRAPFVPLLIAAPALGRYCVFGNLFARMGIGSNGEIHRLDRHPSISQHPITPMREADLRQHLAKQTKKKIALFNILKIALPQKKAKWELAKILAGKPEIILFDALNEEQLKRIGGLIDSFASRKRPLFSVGSSGIEMALAAHWAEQKLAGDDAGNFTIKNKNLKLVAASSAKQLLVGSGSCSPVTQSQIAWALKNDFDEVLLDANMLAPKNRGKEIQRTTDAAAKFLKAGRSVIVHARRGGPGKPIAAKLKNNSANILGTALGKILRGALTQTKIHRLCVAGGDTSSFAARALGIKALEMIAPLTPGAPLCKAFAPDSPAHGLEIVFKGGQVGAENYFGIVKRGKI